MAHHQDPAIHERTESRAFSSILTTARLLPRPFGNRYNPIYTWHCELLNFTAGPVHFDRVHGCCLAQSEVGTRIVR
jgi:hypothetical protein